MGLFPKHAAEYLVQAGIPVGPNSKVFIVDPQHGSDSNTGLSFKSPLLTLEAAYALTTANHNDTVILIGGPTGNAVAAEVNWANSYTHLVGLSAGIGLGQRSRITGSTTVDAVQVMHITGDGCIFKNIGWYNGTDADADSGAVLLTGDRCLFENCSFIGMAHTTPGARAGSFSLKLTGAQENTFVNCQIGTTTVLRAAANGELVMTAASARNTFKDCKFMAYSETAGKFMVILDNSGTESNGINWWENCCFHSLSVNWATPIDNAFNVGAGGTHYVCLPNSYLIGIDGWADVVTRVYGLSAGGAGFGIGTNPTT